MAIAWGNVAPPSVESRISIEVTPTSSSAVHMMSKKLSTYHVSPPFGESTATVGGSGVPGSRVTVTDCVEDSSMSTAT